jgi:catechol 2,3-dioxygenase
MQTASDFFDLRAAPMRIGAVRLKVRDLETVAAFYRRVLGLAPIETGAGRVVLGVGAAPLLHLAGDAALAPSDPRQAGLFHTAFLLPTRADLGRWATHAAASGARIDGASDHIVSEALYLSDPEGNGIEVYADRPADRWRTGTGAVRMATDPLDAPDLLRSAEGSRWAGFPEGGLVGHVHLRVGDTAEADRFYRDVLGFDVAARYPGASFYGSGGYHHQIAGNVWASRGAGPRPAGTAGLDEVGIIVRDAATLEAAARRAAAAGVDVTREDGALVLRDPWGVRIALTR